MSMRRKTITLTEQQDGWVKSRIESGRFGNDSEYIRHLIRQDQQAQERLARLRQGMDFAMIGYVAHWDLCAINHAYAQRSKLCAVNVAHRC